MNPVIVDSIVMDTITVDLVAVDSITVNSNIVHPVCLAFIEVIKQYGGVTETREEAQSSVGASSSSSMFANVGDTSPG